MGLASAIYTWKGKKQILGTYLIKPGLFIKGKARKCYFNKFLKNASQ